MGRRPRSKTPFSTGTQRAHSASRGPPVRTRLRRAHSASRGPPVRTRLRRAHSASRAYGEGHGSKRQRLYPPLHGGKPYRSRWEALLPTHREHSTKARHTVPLADLRSGRAYGEGHGSKRQRLYPPLHGGKPYRIRWEVSHPQGVFRKGRRKSMQDGESLPCGMSRHPSFLYINRNLLANATCFFL